ncbi:MAG: hypothetical protein ACI9TY_001415 [Alphaproteobacteria bacterium]|jgi:hypothetical protein
MFLYIFAALSSIWVAIQVLPVTFAGSYDQMLERWKKRSAFTQNLGGIATILTIIALIILPIFKVDFTLAVWEAITPRLFVVMSFFTIYARHCMYLASKKNDD